MALTQPLAVEPLRWGLRGVAAQCFVVNRIFKYYYFRYWNGFRIFFALKLLFGAFHYPEI
jgi:hypothetical protein